MGDTSMKGIYQMRKLIYSLVSAFFLLTMPFIAGATETKENQSTSTAVMCAAQVKNGVAAFYFPITNNEKWVWYRKSIADNALEYSWEVIIDSTRNTYKFGSYLFKFPNHPQKEGSLEQLLQDGQISVFESVVMPDGGTSGSSREDLVIRAGIIDQWLIVTFKDSKTFSTILNDKPKKAQFVVRHPDESKSYICDSSIIYK